MTRSSHLRKADRWLHSQLSFQTWPGQRKRRQMQVKPQKSWRQILKVFSERQHEWTGRTSRSHGTEGLPHMCQKAANPQDGISQSLEAHTTTEHLFSVRGGSAFEWLSCPGRSVSLADCAHTGKDILHLHPLWCRQWLPSPEDDGAVLWANHLVGYTAVNLYIIIKAAKSSSKRRNYQNKGCQSNFNSASWQICLLMQSLITSSQPTFSSTRLLLHSGHNKQTNKQLKMGQSIFSCLFFCSVCNSRHYLLHAIKFPALRQSYSSSPGFHEYRYVNRELPT